MFSGTFWRALLWLLMLISEKNVKFVYTDMSLIWTLESLGRLYLIKENVFNSGHPLKVISTKF